MQKQFKELAGTQLRKPIIECFAGGSSLEGALLVPSNEEGVMSIKVNNSGDAPARKIYIKLYANLPEDCYIVNGLSGSPFSDEPAYKAVYETHNRNFSLDPKESQILSFEINWTTDKIIPGNYPAKLKVYYEQPEPKVYNFQINVAKKQE